MPVSWANCTGEERKLLAFNERLKLATNS
jgi:hypothetical protein